MHLYFTSINILCEQQPKKVSLYCVSLTKQLWKCNPIFRINSNKEDKNRLQIIYTTMIALQTEKF